MKLKVLIIMLCLIVLIGCRNQQVPPPPGGLAFPYNQLEPQAIEYFQIYWDGERSMRMTDTRSIEFLANAISGINSTGPETNTQNIQCLRGIRVGLNNEIQGSNQLFVCLVDTDEWVRIGPQGREYLVSSKELVEFTKNNKDQKLVIIEEDYVPAEAINWFKEFNRENEGAYIFQHPDGTIIRVDAGERPTGGYGIIAREYSEEDYPRRILVEFTEPREDQMVTEALTYPTIFLKVYTEEASRYEVITQGNATLPTENHLVFAVLETPQVEDRIKSTFRAKGRIIAFEGAFVIRILDSLEKIIHEESLQSDAGGPRWGAFDTEITFQTPETDNGYLEVGEFSAEDGSFDLRIRIPIAFEK